ncbi:dTDP-4-dehydrorhamnose 3,5-epimerase family protein [Enterococcus faecium]|nr:dTDP-4-dehydrorhamnose 3,5-epimerase [Enterococcus faecium]EEV45793.1 dTDP-6-deoxy-D-glucose-3,5 epimerase [Enterococcus faecium 1,231,502]EJX46840.1 putative dTDP-4-dehydrorhamnose 3,5-epimerase [Enterococcus faecium S447]EJX48613.1 putative dTDP-4-dehydrorhamnose 3,5-epimerase [Enterococcus faecium R499]EJX65241.1 putative dTDP-4-dehydrorhamnose 3,5-epimerase [Enterococcus faecium P1986]EJX66007.1 putative dTDP-4-dehydrorhamnose 3,5-epimerase [Enterococcus faecium R446]EJX70391.1 putativ
MVVVMVKVFDIIKFSDFRGYTAVALDNETLFSIGIEFHIKQINQGFSHNKYTMRGLHYQSGEHAQGKIVMCLHGEIMNIALDIRQGSSTYGCVYVNTLSESNGKCAYIPRGYAHGYLTMEDNTLVQWCVDNDFNSNAAKCISYESVDIEWPVSRQCFVISEKDKNGERLSF